MEIINKALSDNVNLNLNVEELNVLKLNSLNPWLDLLSLHKYLTSYQSDNLNDKQIIDYYISKTKIFPVNEQTKEDAFSVYKIVFNLLFKYNLFRTAQSQLLVLKSKLDAPYPTWIQNYSAKALFKIDIDSVFVNVEKFFSMILDGTTNNELDPQAIAVIKDLFNSIPEYIDSKIFFDSDYLIKFITSAQKYILSYDPVFTETWSESLLRINRFIETVNLPSEFDRLFLYKTYSTCSQLIIENKDSEISRLQNTLNDVTNSYNQLNEEIKKQEKDFSAQIASLRKEEIGIEEQPNIDQLQILVLGASQIQDKVIYGLCKNLGISKDQLELITDYDDSKRYDIDKLKYNSKFDGILVGPIAHKIIGTGDHNSAIERLKNEEGFPPVEEIRNKAGELKISKSSFKDSLQKLLDSITSNISH